MTGKAAPVAKRPMTSRSAAGVGRAVEIVRIFRDLDVARQVELLEHARRLQLAQRISAI